MTSGIIDGFKKLTDIALGIGTLSFLFYSTGKVYHVLFFKGLNINRSFSDLSYQEYVFIGVAENLLILALLPILLDWYLALVALRKDGDLLFKLEREGIQSETRTGHTKEEITKLKERMNNIRENFYSRNPFGIKTPFFVAFVLVSLISGLFSYLRDDSLLWFVLGKFSFSILIYLFIFNEVRKSIQDQKIHFRHLFTYLVFIFGFLPMLWGYLTANFLLSRDQFKSIKIITADENIDAKFVAFSKDFLIVRKDNKNLFLTKTEIKRIEMD